MPAGWFDTLTDAAPGTRVIEYIGTENPDPSLRFRVDTSIQSGFVTSAPNQFMFAVQPLTPMESPARMFGFPASISGFSFTINWGDGTVETLTDSDISDGAFTHTYAEPGIYDIVVTGDLPFWCSRFDSSKWVQLSNWGTSELLAANMLLFRTTNLQIVGDALKFPPVTPGVQRWHRAFESCASDYHPSYDTASAVMLDRFFYQAKLVRAPFLDTAQTINFHNFYRSCLQLEGRLPWHSIASAQNLYRYLRNSRKITSEDLPNWSSTNHVRNFNSALADLPLVTTVPSNWSFSGAADDLDAQYDTTGIPGAVHFAASDLHLIGAIQQGATCNVDINSMTIDGFGSFKEAFLGNQGATSIDGMTIEIGHSPGMFRGSSLVDVDITIVQPPSFDNVYDNNLDYAFADCASLTALTISAPNTVSMAALISNTSVQNLSLTIPSASTSFKSIVSGCSTIEQLLLPGYTKKVNAENQQLSRTAILNLVDSLGTPATETELVLGGNPGFIDLTAADVSDAAAKSWAIVEADSADAFIPIDDGQTSPQSFVRFQQTDQEILAICGSDWLPKRLVRSTDGGHTWNVIRETGSGAAYLRTGRAGQNLLLLLSAGSGERLLRLNNLGGTWSGVNPIPDGFTPTALYADGTDSVIVQGRNVSTNENYRGLSTDGGATVSEYNLPEGCSGVRYTDHLGWHWDRADGTGFDVADSINGSKQFVAYPFDLTEAEKGLLSLGASQELYILFVGKEGGSANSERYYIRSKEAGSEWVLVQELSIGTNTNLTAKGPLILNVDAESSEFIFRMRSTYSAGAPSNLGYYSFGAQGPFTLLSDSEFLESALFRDDGVIFTFTDSAWVPRSIFAARDDL
jgi:hypothetical protein